METDLKIFLDDTEAWPQPEVDLEIVTCGYQDWFGSFIANSFAILVISYCGYALYLS